MSSALCSARSQPQDIRGTRGHGRSRELGGCPIADTKKKKKCYHHRFSEESIRGQWRWSWAMGGTLCRHGDGAAADNWAWDSVATKQHGLSNEINDVVLGLVSPRRGLSPNSPPKVKERTITQTQIHQAHSWFRPGSKWCFRAGSGLIPTEKKSNLLKNSALRKSKSIVFNLSSDQLLIKHLRVNINMLFVCDRPDRVMMVVFVRDEFSCALPSLNTGKIFITNALWTMWGDCLNDAPLLKQISLRGLSDVFRTTCWCLSCLSRWIHRKPHAERMSASGGECSLFKALN